MITGGVNYKFEVNGMRFDAAIDFEYQLHPYTEDAKKMLPVELYNLDLDWDIKMSYFDNSFRKIENQGFLLALIREDAEEWCKKWIKEDGTYDSFDFPDRSELDDMGIEGPEFDSDEDEQAFYEQMAREIEEMNEELRD